MMTSSSDMKRTQFQLVTTDELVPENHLLRIIDSTLDWRFIYGLVKDKYSQNMGRPSIDPVVLIKIAFIQYLYGIRSMRQTIKEIEVNVAYRWFLGFSLSQEVPHFSTFGKNYTRRFKDTDLFERVFQYILEECYKYGLVDPAEVFVDSTHVKARANSKKVDKRVVKEHAMFYERMLEKEINEDRIAHGKKPFAYDNDSSAQYASNKAETDEESQTADGSDGRNSQGHVEQTGNGKKTISLPKGEMPKTKKCSATDPESGWFQKGEHKQVFAYGIQTACDKNGWVLDFSVSPGNLHDSRTSKRLFDKLRSRRLPIRKVIADAGYKKPGIAHWLLSKNITPVFPYTRPMTKQGFFKKHEFVYDPEKDRYICPNNTILPYSTTNRGGYREYKSCGKLCETCPFLNKCTQSKTHVKIITRHLWENDMEFCEKVRHTPENRKLYSLRQQTIERVFGTCKESHGFRYTQMYGTARMKFKAAMTFGAYNLKKLAKTLHNWGIRPILGYA